VPRLLEIRDLEVSYGAARTLFGIDLDVDHGERVAVVGHNGWGKSTLARTLMGFLRPAAGSIAIDGLDASRLPPHRIARAGVSLVPQGRHVFPSLTVEENLRLAATTREQRDRWRSVYDLFPALPTRARSRAGTLSGGEQQMLAIARALVRRPSLLVLDEPTEGLAPLVIEQLRETLTALADAEGLALLLLEQRVSFAEALCERVLPMVARGRLGEGHAVAD
jgi:branched-chain amino acid transport system ATP-binding protein